MQLGLIGLGRMGGNMRDRVRAAGHEVIGYDPRPDVTDVESLQALAEALEAPRVVWVMVPSGDPTRETVRKLADVLSAGDLVIDGGNSRYTDDSPTPPCSTRRASATSTAGSPAASGARRTATA